MVRKIILKNYKSYKNEVIELKPMTLLTSHCGGEGKSNVHAALRLMRCLTDDDGLRVQLDGDGYELGNYEDVRFSGGSNTDDVELGFEIELIPEKLFRNKSVFSDLCSRSGFNTAKKFVLHFTVSLDELSYIKKIQITAVAYLGEDDKPEFEMGTTLKHIKGHYYDVFLQSFPSFIGGWAAYKNSNIQNAYCVFSGLKIDKFQSEQVESTDIPLLFDLFKAVDNEFSGIGYLSMFRNEPKRYYPCNSIRMPFFDIGKKGEMAVEYLQMFGDSICRFEDDYKGKLTIKEMTSLWIERIQGDKVQFEWDKVDGNPCARVLVNSKNIVYSGTIVNQLLPIIVLGLMDYNGAVIIEYPEYGLSATSAIHLTGFIHFLAKNGVQVILETHSFDIVQTLLLRCVQNQSVLDMVRMNYIRKSDDSSSKSTVIKISPTEGFDVDTPKDFFDAPAFEIQSVFNAVMNNVGEKYVSVLH